MAFYADQADGFTPALELIQQKTGLNKFDISKIRKQLIDNGFIRYDPGKVVELDWDRIRLYSTFDKTMLPSKRGKATIAPVGSVPRVIIAKPPPKIKQLLWKYKYTESAPVRELTPFEKQFYSKLEAMSEEDVRILFGGVEAMRGESQPVFQKAEAMEYSLGDLPPEQLPHSRDALPF